MWHVTEHANPPPRGGHGSDVPSNQLKMVVSLVPWASQKWTRNHQVATVGTCRTGQPAVLPRHSK